MLGFKYKGNLNTRLVCYSIGDYSIGAKPLGCRMVQYLNGWLNYWTVVRILDQILDICKLLRWVWFCFRYGSRFWVPGIWIPPIRQEITVPCLIFIYQFQVRKQKKMRCAPPPLLFIDRHRSMSKRGEVGLFFRQRSSPI